MAIQQLLMASVAPLSASVSPTTINVTNISVGSAITRSVAITVEGGVAPYSYSSERISGSGTMSVTNAATASPGCSAPGGTNGTTTSATFRTTVTDSMGTTATATWSVSYTWGIPV